MDKVLVGSREICVRGRRRESEGEGVVEGGGEKASSSQSEPMMKRCGDRDGGVCDGDVGIGGGGVDEGQGRIDRPR